MDHGGCALTSRVKNHFGFNAKKIRGESTTKCEENSGRKYYKMFISRYLYLPLFIVLLVDFPSTIQVSPPPKFFIFIYFTPSL